MHTSTYTHMRRFIESSKSRPLGSLEAQQSLAVAVYVYDRVLKLMHPFMPFVTEELWQALPHTGVVCVPVCACVCVCLSACVCVYVYVHVRSCACIRVREFVLCTQSLGTASFAAQRLHVVESHKPEWSSKGPCKLLLVHPLCVAYNYMKALTNATHVTMAKEASIAALWPLRAAPVCMCSVPCIGVDIRNGID